MDNSPDMNSPELRISPNSARPSDNSPHETYEHRRPHDQTRPDGEDCANISTASIARIGRITTIERAMIYPRPSTPNLLPDGIPTDTGLLLSLWSATYKASRERFIDAALNACASLESFPLTAVGPNGERLSIDIATIGAKNPRRGLLVVAGSHGVEGFFGAAVEQGILEAKPVVGDGDAISFVHCLNPFGMAHLRRTNEDNVDINRNFLLATEKFSGMPTSYAEFKRFLNPTQLPNSALAAQLRMVAGYLKHTFPKPIVGFQTLKEGILTGQYEIPDGIFYGGSSHTQSTQILSDWLASTYSNAERIFGIDLHAGLGAWGSDSLFVELAIDGDEFTEISAKLGLKLTGLGPNRATYQPRGALANIVPVLLPDCKVDWILHEFGTSNPFRALSAMVAENSWHQAFTLNSEALALNHWSKRELLEVFNPKSPSWRANTVRRAAKVFQRAGNYLFQE